MAKPETWKQTEAKNANATKLQPLTNDHAQRP